MDGAKLGAAEVTDGWTAYTVDLDLSAGTHVIQIAGVQNDTTSVDCVKFSKSSRLVNQL